MLQLKDPNAEDRSTVGSPSFAQTCVQIGQLDNRKRAEQIVSVQRPVFRSFGLTAHKFERTKTDVLMHHKQRLAKLHLKQLKAESKDVLKRLCPHIGNGAWRKKSRIAGKEPALIN